jgi:hypothetical protein
MAWVEHVQTPLVSKLEPPHHWIDQALGRKTAGPFRGRRLPRSGGDVLQNAPDLRTLGNTAIMRICPTHTRLNSGKASSMREIRTAHRQYALRRDEGLGAR